jgi:pimeloyl-ACP methyl ester carboxylesterase
MVEEQVRVIGYPAAGPAEVWAVARDFGSGWHPAIDRIRAERDARGALIRAFTCFRDTTLYREQLTYRSDSDRSLAYTHLQGIAGVECYAARLTVSPGHNGGSMVEWSARLTAPPGRVAAIAAGTKAIFEEGISALAEKARLARPAPPRQNLGVAPAPLEELVIDGEPRLAVTVTSASEGPLVVFLHGIGGGRTNWLPQLHAVAPQMRAAALDLRGYGGSMLGPNRSTVDDYCADILRVADALKTKRLVLCGLSYGAWIATSFAIRHPDRLAGLVLSGGSTGMSEASVEEREAFRRSREVPLDEGRAPADFAPAVVDLLAGPNASEDVRMTLLASMSAISAATYRDALSCFTHPPERFDFSRLVMPVLMMTGEHDRLAPPAEIRGVARRIADLAPRASVRFEVIADAGHVCNVERPAAYNTILTEFLSEIAQ